MGNLVPVVGSALGAKFLSKGGKAPEVTEVAERAERQVDIEPEDIELGGVDSLSEDPAKAKGKRALLKPSGAKATSGLNV